MSLLTEIPELGMDIPLANKRESLKIVRGKLSQDNSAESVRECLEILREVGFCQENTGNDSVYDRVFRILYYETVDNPAWDRQTKLAIERIDHILKRPSKQIRKND